MRAYTVFHYTNSSGTVYAREDSRVLYKLYRVFKHECRLWIIIVMWNINVHCICSVWKLNCNAHLIMLWKFQICECLYVNVDMWMLICECWYVNVDMWMLICECWYANVDVWLLICECWCVNVDVWMLICECWCVNVDMWMLICECWCVNVDVWMLMCECWCVNVDMWMLMCECWYVNVDMRMLMCDCWYVNVDMWMWICECWYVTVDMWMLICECWYVNVDMWMFSCDYLFTQWCILLSVIALDTANVRNDLPLTSRPYAFKVKAFIMNTPKIVGVTSNKDDLDVQFDDTTKETSASIKFINRYKIY